MNQLQTVLLALAAGGAAVLAGWLYAAGSADQPVQDRQPVDFSHELHAGRLQTDCLFCHRHPEESRVAGVPSMAICMTCHQSLTSHSPAMEELLAHWTAGRPIPWVRLQRLPDHVYFTHERHLAVGLRCQDCHGRVEGMRYTPRAPSYEMGWCLSCHGRRNASKDCLTCHK